MQAMNGPRYRGRGRGGLIGCVIALLALSAMMTPSIASAKKSKPVVKETYLALGDSLAFGYSQQLYNEGIEKGYDNPELFEKNYNTDYWSAHKGEANGIALQNDGCPGETTESLIGKALATKLNEAAPLKESQEKKESYAITGENPCGYQEAWNAYKKVGLGGPLHHSYVGKSQLEDAIATIRNKQNVEKQPVTTITLDVGANDELHAVAGVEKEIEAKVKAIAEAEVRIKYVEPAVKKELEEKYVIPAVNKEIEEKYIDPYLFVTYIQPKAREECKQQAEAEHPGATEEEIEAYANGICASEYEPGVTVEEAYEYNYAHSEPGEKELAEKGAAYAKEHEEEFAEKGQQLGLEYQLEHKKELKEKGEVLGYEYSVEHKAELQKKGEEFAHQYALENHSKLAAEATQKIGEEARGEGAYAGKSLFEQIISNLGGILYALRNGSKFGGVDYSGKIIFLQPYDPYGKLFKTAEEANTFVEAHGGLAGPFGSEDTAGPIHPGFNELAAALASAENGTLSSFGSCPTNAEPYFNPGNSKEPGRLKSLTNMANGTITAGKYDGPDIHPTPAGYLEISKLMKAACG